MQLFNINIKLSLLSLLFCFQAVSQQKDIAYYISKSPFPMPEVIVPKFKNQVFLITNYGAIGNGKTLNTEAINKTIQACSDAGGGIVEIPKGVWLTGPIELKSNVNIHTNKGTLVQFTKDRTQYPVFKPQGSGSFIVKSPIFGNNLENIALTGEGIYDGAGESWRPVKKSKVSSRTANMFPEKLGDKNKDTKEKTWAEYQKNRPNLIDCFVDERKNWYGNHRCTDSWECKGARVCEEYARAPGASKDSI